MQGLTNKDTEERAKDRKGNSKKRIVIHRTYLNNRLCTLKRNTAKGRQKRILTITMTQKRMTKLQVWISLAALTLGMMSLNGCRSDAQDEANKLLEEAEAMYNKKQYAEALLVLDSLRYIYPTAIHARHEALKLKQDIALKQAQQELALVDSALQAVNANYKYLQGKVEREKADLCVTPQALELLTRTRIKRDSLQTQFDVLCAKIKYINKKKKEN